MQLKIQREEKESLAKRFHLTNQEHQKLFNENILINGMVHKQKNQKIKKIQVVEKQKYKKLLKLKKEEFKEEIQEKLRQTGIFIPGLTRHDKSQATRKPNVILAISKADPKSKAPQNHMISEIVTSKNPMTQVSGFYVNYDSSESKSDYYISDNSIKDEQITTRLNEMQDERQMKQNVEFNEDLDQISLDMVDPKNFTLGRDNNQLKDISQGLSYVNQDELKANKLSNLVMQDDRKGKKKWKSERVEVKKRKKEWSEADSFSADSEEGSV